jgi:hypothetical protein
MGAFGGSPQKAQSLRLDVQIETRQKHWFPHVNHQLITVSRENVGTLLIKNNKLCVIHGILANKTKTESILRASALFV